MAAPPPPPKGGGMSLYANLLNTKADSSASISGAPVLYDNGEKDDASAKKEVNPGAQGQHTFSLKLTGPEATPCDRRC